MHYTCSPSLKNITNAVRTGMATDTSASPLIGIITIERCICRCQGTKTKPSNNFNITNLPRHSIHRSSARKLNTVRRSSTPSKNPPRSYWIKNTRSSFRKCAVNSCSSLVPSILLYCAPSAQLYPNRRNRPQTRCNKPNNSWIISRHKSDMILAAHSDASYLSEPQVRSRAGAHFFLSNAADIPANNGAILNIAHIIKHVMASATQAELAALYINAREAVYIRIILEELGHKQPATPLQTDNAMADAVCNGKNTAKMHQSHGHAISLAAQSQVPRTISNLLAPWQAQLS